MASLLCILTAVNCSATRNNLADELLRTLLAVAWVESAGDPRAVGDAGLAVGILQIQPVMVADCNRILGREEYTLKDRWDVERSAQMFCVFVMHYFPNGTPEQWARAWNGGPTGPQKRATEGYWSQVRRQMGPD